MTRTLQWEYNSIINGINKGVVPKYNLWWCDFIWTVIVEEFNSKQSNIDNVIPSIIKGMSIVLYWIKQIIVQSNAVTKNTVAFNIK